MATSTTTWFIGCGNIGKRVINLIKKRQHNTETHLKAADIKAINIMAMSHSPSSVTALEKLDIKVINADLDIPVSLNNLNTANSNIFYFAPPSLKGESDIRMLNFIQCLKSSTPPKRIVLISTTGVYGDHTGEWITEKTPTNPQAGRAKRRLSAEAAMKKYCDSIDCEYIILRVAGIYDLEKLPLQRIKNGVKVLLREIAPSSNRIHAADLANICVAAMESPVKNSIYNVADGSPSSISDYFFQISETFSLTPPQEINWEEARQELSEGMLSYLSESKKIDVTRMLNQLNINLTYPSLKMGLDNCKAEYDLLAIKTKNN